MFFQMHINGVNRIIKTRTAVEDADDGGEVIAYDGVPPNWIKPLRNETSSDVVVNLPTSSIHPQHIQVDEQDTLQKQKNPKIVPTRQGSLVLSLVYYLLNLA
jgi:hypothetical protein